MMTADGITQKKVDAICARILHQERLDILRRRSKIVDALALAVPIAYMAIRFLEKGSPAAHYVEWSWEIVAALLAISTGLKMLLGWTDVSERHSKQIGENISLITQADYLLSKPAIDPEAALLFKMLADSHEKQDRDLLGSVDAKTKQRAYREALKKFGSGVLCPNCKSSPWKFVPGSCQMCGGTPQP
jgi:mobilome CxxCx(11)CxxC protein